MQSGLYRSSDPVHMCSDICIPEEGEGREERRGKEEGKALIRGVTKSHAGTIEILLSHM